MIYITQRKQKTKTKLKGRQEENKLDKNLGILAFSISIKEKVNCDFSRVAAGVLFQIIHE